MQFLYYQFAYLKKAYSLSVSMIYMHVPSCIATKSHKVK